MFVRPSASLATYSTSSLVAAGDSASTKPVREDNGEEALLYPPSNKSTVLPIYEHKDAILYGVESHHVLILASETGTGKSTQLPQYLYDSGWSFQNTKKILCTQPRRMAAVTVASKVASEMGVKLGSIVGYSIRFDNKVSENTAIKYCTDGILLNEIMFDPLLSTYSVIIIDEAHERSLYSDILLGLLKKIHIKRNDLKLIITSATLNIDALYNFFKTNTNKVGVLSVKANRPYNVDIHYLKEPCNNYIKCAIDTIMNIHQYEERGDIIVFIPGSEEIDTAIAILKSYDNNTALYNSMYVLPLYSSLPYKLQMRVFETTPVGMRKVIFTTNIAETSVTIQGIKYVVDCGFTKLSYFNNYNGINSLITCAISKSSALQRSGRAGRIGHGKCYRLYTELDFNKMQDYTPPEMVRCDVISILLKLKLLGIHNVLQFQFLTTPTVDSIVYSLEVLYSLQAIDDGCNITKCGEYISLMPIEPRLAKSLLDSIKLKCHNEMVTIAAMCAVDYPYINSKYINIESVTNKNEYLLECIGRFVQNEGDHLTLLTIYNEYIKNGCDSKWCDANCLQTKVLMKAVEIRKHLIQMLKSVSEYQHLTFDNTAQVVADTVNIRKCLISGYFSNVAELKSDGRYYTFKGNTCVHVHHTSVFNRFIGILPQWVLYNEIIHTKEIYMRDIIHILPQWLIEVSPFYYELKK